jgi:hypothetical protein
VTAGSAELGRAPGRARGGTGALHGLLGRRGPRGLPCACLLAAALAGCSRGGGASNGNTGGGGNGARGAALGVAAAGPAAAASSGGPGAAPSGAAGAAGAVAVPAGSSGRLATLEAVKPACCWLDRAEGVFGPARGINARYSGDYLKRKDGERLLFPDDLISDTKELFQFARSAGKPLYQERRLKIVGERRGHISVEIDDRGETGATAPFAHSKCKTIEVRTGRSLKVDDVAGKDAGPALLAEGKRRLAQAPEHEHYLFVPTSFVVLEKGGHGGPALRFCNPRKDERLGSARLDIELPLDEPDAK